VNNTSYSFIEVSPYLFTNTIEATLLQIDREPALLSRERGKAATLIEGAVDRGDVYKSVEERRLRNLHRFCSLTCVHARQLPPQRPGIGSHEQIRLSRERGKAATLIEGAVDRGDVYKSVEDSVDQLTLTCVHARQLPPQRPGIGSHEQIRG
jgi:hypothetical protein